MAIRVGFVGLGGIMGVHLQHLSRMKDVKLVAFCDVRKNVATAIAKRYGGTAYSDCGEMYKEERLDAVYIAVPPNAHGAPELLALKRGIHLFIEKPIAVDRDTAMRVAEALSSSQCIASVGYQWRYSDIVQRARRVPAGREPSLVLGWWLGGAPGVPWWVRKDESGGQIVEQTTHIFDLARYLCGEVTCVYAAASTGLMKERKDFTVEDSSTVTLLFENNAVGNISSTCVHDGFSKVGLLCVCKELAFELAGDTLRVTDMQCTHEYRRKVDPYLAENETFIKSVINGSSVGILATYEDALKTHSITMAANEAIKESVSRAIPV
jgi:myo-inositol 2-dehydrogenase/D-chiro-inositol 1-dehydrogenase